MLASSSTARSQLLAVVKQEPEDVAAVQNRPEAILNGTSTEQTGKLHVSTQAVNSMYGSLFRTASFGTVSVPC